MVCSTNLSLGMYPGLTHGAISALYAHGSDELKQTYLEKLISGEWTGTMCLTEPQCGTDLGMIRTRATPNDDGSYAIEGTKIWITGGEHDLTDNIVHLVLAKLPGAPDTTKGISLFIVPKFLPESGERNPAFCGGLEHKMGIKGSATCVMNFEGANNANTGLQVLGGSGFTTDWPLEQLVRDGRIARIYEGTNGIQAMDLVGRKLSLKGGQLVRTLFGVLSSYLKDNPEAPHREDLKGAMGALEKATMWLATNAPKDPEQAGAAATPYLRLMALTVVGYMWSRMANVASQQLAAGEGNKPLLEAKLVSARFYFEKLLPEIHWLLSDIESGKDTLMDMGDDHWAG
ncbi:acyl-CoA dehydrogenase C-terminal domain-containing protein [uncultured Marinobacter sp.]|uniref:acyl-CoA dehydrogenase C-terminal domain-containing protein n=1 Tax=uncultured Marinobacter sp. TaxID=187379 RepID=UPI00344EF083